MPASSDLKAAEAACDGKWLGALCPPDARQSAGRVAIGGSLCAAEKDAAAASESTGGQRATISEGYFQTVALFPDPFR